MYGQQAVKIGLYCLVFFKRDANNVLGQQKNMTSRDLSRVSVVRLSGLGQWNPNEMMMTDRT